MAWKGVITNIGQVMLDQIASGEHTLHITGATVGSGIVAEANMRIATDLVSEQDTAVIVSAEPVTGGTKIKVQVGPADNAAYTAHEIGIWARVDSGTPALFSLHQDAEGGVGVPLASVSPDFAFGLYALIASSNNDDLEVTVDTSAVVSQSAMNAALSGKLDKASVYNGLDKSVAGFALDARQGKALNDAMSNISTLTFLNSGIGLDFYYNRAVVVIRINTVITNPVNDDTTSLQLPPNVRFIYATQHALFAMTTSWAPTGNNVILTADANGGHYAIRYQTVPGSSIVLAGTFVLPRAWFIIPS